MSNIQSYNALIDRFKAFASGHFILKTFSHGQIDTADLEKFTQYPFMHVVPSNVTYAKGQKTFSFQIVLADLPRDKDDKVEFQREVLSDLQRIAEDLVAEITNHRVLFGDLITVQNVSLEPFLEEFHNTLTGWTVSLDLLVPYYWDACSIPAEWNDMFESGSGGTGSILTFIDSITRDEFGNVSLVNDEATPAPNYYYGTDGEGVRGWYLLSDEIGLTCETIGSCQTIIDIEAAIDLLQQDVIDLNADVALKANTDDISAVGFSNDYNDLDNLPTIPPAITNTSELVNDGADGVNPFITAQDLPDTSGFVPYTGATQNVDLGTNELYVNKVFLLDEPNNNYGSIHYTDGNFHIEDGDGHPLLVIEDEFMQIHKNATIQSNLWTSELTAIRDHFLPDQSGTVALTSDIPSIAGLVPETRAINTTSPIVGGGNLTADRTISIPAATALVSGHLTAADWATFNAKQNALGFTPVPTTRTLTINGTTQDLSVDRTFTIATGLTVGTTPITSGTVGRVLFEGTGNVLQQSANLFWDNTNGRLGVGTTTPTSSLNVRGAGTSSVTTTLLVQNSAGVSMLQLRDDNYQLVGNWLAIESSRYLYRALSTVGIFTICNDSTVQAFVNLYGSTHATLANVLDLGTASTSRLRIAANGNVLIGTTTDAGFKLDVNGTARVSGLLTASASANITGILNVTAQTKIGTTVYSDGSSALILGKLAGASAARGFLASDTNYQDFGFVNTNIGAGNINAWNFGQRQDTYFGNALGSFQIVGAYFNNSGAGSMVGGGFRVPLICNPDGTIVLAGAANSINGNVLIGGTTNAASGALQIESTTKGFLPPRMTTTQKNAIATPAAGLMVYDTTLNLMSVYNGTTWISL